MTLFELAGKITLDSSEYESKMKGALGTASKFAKGLDTGISKLTKIGMTAGGAAVAAVVAFGKASVKTGMQFDTAMSQVAATMGVTTDQIAELRDFAMEMGANTAFSATQAAEALNYMALAGYDADTSMQMLPNVLNLAAAGAMDLGRASDMLTDSQSALGLTIEETNTLVDQMAKTASKSNTSVSQLGDAILTVGGTARNLRGGTTELATALGILADNGVKGAEGGTALRNILLSLSAPTDVAAKKMQELGVSVFDAEGNMRGLNDIFGDLDSSLGALTQEQRMDALATIFNNRDLKSATALMSNYGTRWDELSGYIDDAAGAAQQMADTQLDNLNGDITLMKSALEGVKIEFSDGINPALRDSTQRMTALLSKNTTQKFFREFGEAAGEAVTTLTKWGSNALPRVIKEFENGAPRVKAFGIAFAGLALAVKATVNPVGTLLTALGLLTGGMALAALGADDMGKKFS
ncbi:MAG: phage tail tape measure protein, partial [Oscillospiraceae bacterium]|nr:phage tail tape measure protein [Oscillospiraceae bacterium]